MASLTLDNAIIFTLSNSMHLNHATHTFSIKTTIYIMKTTYTNKTLYKYAYAMFPEPLTQETESLTQVAVSQTQIAESQTQMVVSQTQIAESQTHLVESQTQMVVSQTQMAESQTQLAESQTQILKSPRLRNYAPMQYAPKTFYDNTPKIHKHVITPISQTPITIFKSPNYCTKSYNSFQTLHIIFIL
jgi:paraquat-inducible protein B